MRHHHHHHFIIVNIVVVSPSSLLFDVNCCLLIVVVVFIHEISVIHHRHVCCRLSSFVITRTLGTLIRTIVVVVIVCNGISSNIDYYLKQMGVVAVEVAVVVDQIFKNWLTYKCLARFASYSWVSGLNPRWKKRSTVVGP